MNRIQNRQPYDNDYHTYLELDEDVRSNGNYEIQSIPYNDFGDLVKPEGDTKDTNDSIQVQYNKQADGNA